MPVAVRRRSGAFAAALGVLLLLAPRPAVATNFVNLPAFSAASQGMGGARTLSACSTPR